ncbi:MAG: LD-carboxypeptidase [Verrucomicrobia bacterium]|nr:LD-carboxypeptidase [Verrucomicrobiota bacterium]
MKSTCPILPRALQPGGTIGLVCPASAPPDAKAIDRGIDVLQKLGFKVKLAPNVRKRRGFLAGSDRDRASDLMRMFTDRKVDAILCVRGGYGTARLLPLLDYDLIRANPKIFVGYSDITSLHCAFLTKANLVSFHGPMINSDFVNEDMPRFTLESFLRTLGANPGAPASCRRVPLSTIEKLTGKMPALPGISQGYRRKTIKILRRGIVHGQLIGGNLTLLCTTLGTPWQPPFRNCILFLEDLGEQPFRFDRMFTQLLNCGLLQQVAGIAIGINADCDDLKAKRSKEYRQSLDDVFRERLLPLKIPIVTGLPFGHVPHNATLAIGADVTLNADRGELHFNGPVVI